MQGAPCFLGTATRICRLYNSSKPFESLFRDDAQLAVDRGLAELRAGRPIVIETPDGPAVVAALDAVAPSVLDAFTLPSEGRRSLALSLDRAKVLDLRAGGPIAVAIEGLDNDAVYRLATGVDALITANWEPADTAAAAAIELCKHALLLPAALVARENSSRGLPDQIYHVTLEQLRSHLTRGQYELEIVSRAQVP